MSYFNLLTNAARRIRILLVFLMLLIGLSAAAGTYYADLNVAVNPADLDEGDMVVMCHVNSKAFVGYDGSKELTTTHVKTSDQTEAKAFVYTVANDGYKLPSRMAMVMDHELKIVYGGLISPTLGANLLLLSQWKV